MAHLRASALVESLQKVGTTGRSRHRRAALGLPPLGRSSAGACVAKAPIDREHLHASLALLPVDASQVDYLFARLLRATASELPVVRDALKAHRSTLTPKLWTELENARPGDPGPPRLRRRPWQSTTPTTPAGPRSAARWPRRW